MFVFSLKKYGVESKIKGFLTDWTYIKSNQILKMEIQWKNILFRENKCRIPQCLTGNVYQDGGSGRSRNPVRRSNSSPEMSASWKNPFMNTGNPPNEEPSREPGPSANTAESKKKQTYTKDLRWVWSFRRCDRVVLRSRSWTSLT